MIAVAVAALAVVFTIVHRWRQWLREQALDEVFAPVAFDPVAFGVAAAHQTLDQCEPPLSTFSFRTRSHASPLARRLDASAGGETPTPPGPRLTAQNSPHDTGRNQ